MAALTRITIGTAHVELAVSRPGENLVEALSGEEDGDPVALLSPREADIYRGFKFKKRRDDWLSGRLVAKVLLLHHLGEEDLAPSRVEVLPEESRLPVAYRVLDDGGSGRIPVSFSLSHRGGAAAAALVDEATGLVGVDIEVMEPRSEALAEDNFTPDERAIMNELPPVAAGWSIAIIWSLKEAALKAAGLGLSVPTTDAEVVELDVGQGEGRVMLRGEAGDAQALMRVHLEEPLIVSVAVVLRS